MWPSEAHRNNWKNLRNSLLTAGCTTKLQKKRWQRQKNQRVYVGFLHCSYRIRIRFVTCQILLLCHAPFSSDAFFVKNALTSMLPLLHREIYCSWEGLETVNSVLLSHCASQSVNLSIISQSSATSWKAEVKESNNHSKRRRGHRTLNTALSACLKASNRLVHFRSFCCLMSQLLSVQLMHFNWQIQVMLWESLAWSCCLKSAQVHAIKCIWNALLQKKGSSESCWHIYLSMTQLGRSQTASLWDVYATDCAAMCASQVHSISVFRMLCLEKQCWCNNKADCRRVWMLLSL